MHIRMVLNVVGLLFQILLKLDFIKATVDKQILQNNLYGVDINAESVEITKLSLWLKTAKKDQTLASLDNNIKCGNSLICDESIAEELAFNWKNEFSEIMEKGGFDIIIGNPPYGASIDEATKKYIAENYKTTEGRYDTYKTFFELGFKLLKENGYLGYITPNTFLVLENGASKLRDVLFRENSLINLVELFNVFKTATVEPIISIFKKTKPKIDNTFEVLTLPRKTILSNTFEMEGNSYIFTQLYIIQNENLIFNYRQSILEAALLNKIKKSSIPLFKIFDVFQGIIPYGKGEGKPKQTDDIVKTKPFTGYTKIDDTWKPFIRGKKVNRYLDMWDGEHIKYGAHLCRPRNPNIFVNEKIFIRQTSDYPVCTLDKTG
ncbi:MAG: Eco57I restriction-modification methylase domain-containing protein [Tissierellia bacterium]|nr:Eco57I restriction-modification methylase domain-containing protein [Tissierellia bacterium]